MPAFETTLTDFSPCRTPHDAAARLISTARRRDHVQPLLCSLHWSSRTDFFPAGGAGVSLPPRRRTRLPGVSYPARIWPALFEYSQCSSPDAPCVITSAIVYAFLAAATSIWNILPASVRESPSLPVFHRRLKTELFARSYRCSDYSVSRKNLPWGFVAIFPKRFGIFRSNFICLLGVPIYARIRIFIQLSATLMKLCHIKHDHPVHIMRAKCPPSAETHTGIF